MIAPLYALAAALAGVAQARMLGRAARQRPSPLGLLLRMGVVAAVLLMAARAGTTPLLAAAAAWLAGFALAALWVYRGLR